MRSLCLAGLLLSLVASVWAGWNDVETYQEADLHCPTPIFLFIYYDGANKGKCMACEQYKPWIASLKGTIGAFTVKKLNFNDHPRLALRFRATEFPAFFIQHQGMFKNLSALSFYDLGIAYQDKLYANDIDAIFQNVQVVDKIPLISGIKAPSSTASLLYSYLFMGVLLSSYLLDRLVEAVPVWALLLTTFALLVSTSLVKSSLSKPSSSAPPAPASSV